MNRSTLRLLWSTAFLTFVFLTAGSAINAFTAGNINETIWPDSISVIKDSGPEGNDYELGTIFRSNIGGIITHARVFALASETGVHAIRIWRNSDNQLLAGPYLWDYQGAAGWITLDIDDLIIAADTDYTIAISTGSWDKSYPYIPYNLLSAGDNGAHLSYSAGAGVFSTVLGIRPTTSYQGSNYLRDVIFNLGTAPDTEITVGPAEGALLNSLPVTFTCTGSDDFTPVAQLLYSYRVDGGTWSSWGANAIISLSSLADGYHSFEVKTLDQAGMEDETPAIRHFTLDLTSPDTFFTTGPAEGIILNAMPQTYSFSGLDSISLVGELQYSTKLDNAAWSAWSNATSISIHTTKLGAHTLQIKARDLAGWEDTTPAVRHFTLIDTLTPETQLVSTPGAMNKIPAIFTWQGTDNVTPSNQLKFSWRLNGGAWSAWSTSKVLQLNTLLELMPYTFEVRAMDLAGLIDPTPAKAKFIIDITAPSTTITYGPINGALVNKPMTFYWVGSDNLTASTDLTFSYRLDSGAWSSWSNVRSVTYPSLATGTHRFQVRAKDSAGNIDLTPDSRNFKPDNIAPNTVIVAGPAQNSKVPLPINFQWVGTDNLTPSGNLRYSWHIDNGAWSNWSLAFNLKITSLTPGQHIFYVRAIDISNNIETSPDSRAFYVINPTALNTFINSGPAEGSLVHFPLTFTWSGIDDTTPVNQLKYSWRVSLGPWSTISAATSVSFNSLPWDGAHSFEVRAIDTDGNVDTTPALRNFSADGVAPNTYESWIQRQVYAGQPFTAYWSGADNLTAATALNFRWRLDGNAWSAWATAASTILTLTPGSHTFEVQSRDNAGNIDATPLAVIIYAQ